MSHKLLIHAGFGKTGTSALQNFFVRNLKRLAANKIYYPAAGRQELDAHHYLATKARPGEGTGFTCDETWDEQIEAIAREVGKKKSGTVLISSEVFSGRLEWFKLNKLFDLFDEVSVVLYLRRQDEIVMSSYQQWIKDGTFSASYEEMDALPYFYDKSLKLWSDFLRGRKGRIIVRPYEKSAFQSGTIFSDFMYHAFGIEDISKFNQPSKSASNLRLNETALEFKRCLNRICPEHICADLLSSLLDYSNDRQNRASAWDGSIFPPSKRQEMMRVLFDEGNAKIARDFLGRADGKLFQQPLPHDDDNWREPCLTEESLFDIATYLLHLKYPGEEAQHVRELLRGAFAEPDAIKATITLLVRELYGLQISGEALNEPEGAVMKRHKDAIKAARSATA